MNYNTLAKEENKVIGYVIYTSRFDSKELKCNAQPHDFNIFKSVSNHEVFANLVQSYVSRTELLELNSKIARLEDKELTEFSLTESEESKLLEYRARLNLVNVIKESVKLHKKRKAQVNIPLLSL